MPKRSSRPSVSELKMLNEAITDLTRVIDDIEVHARHDSTPNYDKLIKQLKRARAPISDLYLSYIWDEGDW